MYVIVGPPRQPPFDLCGFVGGVVVDDDMDIETFGNARVDLLEKIQKLGGPMTLAAFADHEPRRDIEGSEQRGGSVAYIAGVRRSGMPGIIGRTGCSRSSAWIWLFSSTLRTSAWLGGDR